MPDWPLWVGVGAYIIISAGVRTRIELRRERERKAEHRADMARLDAILAKLEVNAR